MGVEFHITRAEYWAENEGAEIRADEWLAFVASDPELALATTNGPYFAVWSGPSAYEEPWLDWSEGNVSSKWPDTALYRKMLSVAQALGAKVQDDEGTIYSALDEWEFDPNAPRVIPGVARRPWWRFW